MCDRASVGSRNGGRRFVANPYLASKSAAAHLSFREPALSLSKGPPRNLARPLGRPRGDKPASISRVDPADLLDFNDSDADTTSTGSLSTARSAACRPAIARERSYLFDSGGNLMKQLLPHVPKPFGRSDFPGRWIPPSRFWDRLLVAVAMVSLATTGCVNTSQFVRNNCGPACHMARSRSAPRLDIVRTVCFEGGLLGDMFANRNKSCGSCCGACDCTCGYPEDYCCDASCGCADCCCDASCGCPDASCGCPEASCGCDSGSCCGDCGRSPCLTAVGKVASGFCPHSSGYPTMYNFNPGPPVGQTAYPYYTTRGPRDFLQNNPPTIGPY